MLPLTNSSRDSRRQFLAMGMAGTLAGCLSPVLASDKQPARVLLRSSWQTVNIGDIAHTPGVLALLERHLPGAEVWLWPSRVDNGVDRMLLTRFPKLKIVQGREALAEAFRTCDFLLHGSGPSLVAEKDVARWSTETGKPFGVYGITLGTTQSTATTAAAQETISKTIEVLNRARFVFFRDSVSMAFAKSQGCQQPVMRFAPDGAFAVDLRDDERAQAFLEKNQLVAGEYLCCIPRLRYTPYWKIPSKKAAFDPKKHARNEELKEQDHAPHREAICEIVRNTRLKVLICPEDQTQMEVGRELLYDPLPEDVKKRVVWRPEYWLTGEAVSTYVRSAGLFGNEMHSPIMCVGNGVPAIVCRWSEQTSKGLMWRDIGLSDWLFDFDIAADRARLVPTVMQLAQDPAAARAKVAAARQRVETYQRETMGLLGVELSRKLGG
jgi:polysaccharide pyruvyl transferase WcaK-like protein